MTLRDRSEFLTRVLRVCLVELLVRDLEQLHDDCQRKVEAIATVDAARTL